MDKINRILFKRIHKDTKGRGISFDEFAAQYFGQLAFLYVDTFGLNINTVRNIMRFR